MFIVAPSAVLKGCQLIASAFSSAICLHLIRRLNASVAVGGVCPKAGNATRDIILSIAMNFIGASVSVLFAVCFCPASCVSAMPLEVSSKGPLSLFVVADGFGAGSARANSFAASWKSCRSYFIQGEKLERECVSSRPSAHRVAPYLRVQLD